MALSENMIKNKDLILKLDMQEKWDKKTLTAHLISASCAKNSGHRNSLTLCLFTESAGTYIMVSDFGNDLSTSATFTEKLEAAEVKVFAKNRLISRLLNSFPCASFAFKVKQELTYLEMSIHLPLQIIQTAFTDLSFNQFLERASTNQLPLSVVLFLSISYTFRFRLILYIY